SLFFEWNIISTLDMWLEHANSGMIRAFARPWILFILPGMAATSLLIFGFSRHIAILTETSGIIEGNSIDFSIAETASDRSFNMNESSDSIRETFCSLDGR